MLDPGEQLRVPKRSRSSTVVLQPLDFGTRQGIARLEWPGEPITRRSGWTYQQPLSCRILMLFVRCLNRCIDKLVTLYLQGARLIVPERFELVIGIEMGDAGGV